MSIEEFENWKILFIKKNFSDNIYFKLVKKLEIKSNFAPAINTWTAQPKNTIKN